MISSLCVYAKINDLGFIETPYRKVNNGIVDLSEEGVRYYSAEEEEELVIAQASSAIDEDGKFTNKWVKARKDADFPLAAGEDVDLIYRGVFDPVLGA